MILLPLQTLLLVAACFGLFRLWRAAQPPERWLQLVVAAGFLARAILGQALYWISWGRLPFARSLQLGNGYWVFAQDARFYVWKASLVAEKGLPAIATFDRAAASPTYVQILAAAEWLLGDAACVALLLNLFCYLGAIAILVHWMRADPRTRTAGAIAIAAVSLSPAFVLWSLQALKDPLFQFLFIAFVAACAAWQRAWMTGGPWRVRIGTSVLMAILIYALAGLRWYFAFLLLATASLFMLLVALQAAGRRAAAFAAAAVVIVVLSQSFRASAEGYLPKTLRDVLRPSTALEAVPKTPHSVLATVEQAREGFHNSPANTAIQSGQMKTPQPKRAEPAPAPVAAPPAPPPVAATPPPVAATPPPAPPAMASSKPPTPPVKAPAPAVQQAPAPPPTAAPPPPPSFTPADEAQIRAAIDAQTAAWNRNDLARYMDGYWKSPALVLDDGEADVHGWDDAADAVRRKAVREGGTLGTLRIDGLRVAGLGDVATASGHWLLRQSDGSVHERLFTCQLRRFPAEGWKIVRAVYRRPAPPAPVLAERSRVASFLTGVAVLVVPHTVGERLGIFHVGGGRGMLWFTDVDTIVFDLILAVAIFALTLRPAVHWRNPLTWLVLLLTLLIGGALAYSITNFGTLFRLREMLFLGLLLTPLVVASSHSTQRGSRSDLAA